MSTVLISEVFGPTIQGEGPHAGWRCSFVRLGGCNLTCTWCDTPYTWDGHRFDLRAELTRTDVQVVLDKLADIDTGMVVISGGEPLLQDRPTYGLRELADRLSSQGKIVDVETNGTLYPSDELAECVDLFVVSPKLPNAGMAVPRTIKPNVLRRFADLANYGHAALKVVCATPSDVEHAAAIAWGSGWPSHAVWVMPMGISAPELIERGKPIAEEAIARGMNFTSRQHVLLWGEERGR